MPNRKPSKSARHPSLERLEARQFFAAIVGTGLTGQYFNNKDFTSLKVTRTDAAVNFNWGAYSPSSSIAVDTFSARWTGQIIPGATESYTFYTSSDDGVRLWIDGQLVIDKFVNQAATEWASAPVQLTAGQPVNVQMDYYENYGEASAKLMWSSSSTPKGVIPKANLLPTMVTTPLPPAPPPPLPPPPLPPPPPPASGDNVLRIDAAGSTTYTDSSGTAWLSDRYYSGGSLTLGAFDIANTTDDALYYTRRFGKTFSYGIPLPQAGTYRVSLSFADASYNAGGRIFNVTAEGKPLLTNFDIVAAGGKGNVVTKSFDIPVTDGKLNLYFAGVVNNATISTIAVQPLAVTPTITWKTVAPSPVPRAEAPGAIVNGKLYAFGGLYSAPDGSILAQTRSDVYDPATNTWTRLGDMPVAFTHAGTAVDGTTIWFVGHYTGDHPGPGSSEVWKYDTLTDTWSRGPDLPEARGAGGAAIVGRTIYFFGGMDETRTIEEGDTWSLDLDDPAATWQTRASLPNPRNHTVGIAVGGKIYCIGGQYNQEEAQVTQSEVDCYDPATDTWTPVASLPAPRSHIDASTFLMDGKIIVMGGEVGYDQPQNTILSYDPVLDQWSTIGSLPAGRSTEIAGLIGTNQLISAAGNGPDATTTTWIGTIG